MFDTGMLYYDMIADNDLDAGFDEESGILRIINHGDLLYEKDLNLYVKDLLERQSTAERKDILTSEEAVFIDENEKIKVRSSLRVYRGAEMLSPIVFF